MITLFLQLGHGYSALLAGASTVSFALASALGAGLSSRISARIGARILPLGLALVCLGLLGVLVVITVADSSGIGWAMAAPLAVAGAGSGMVIAPNQALTLTDVAGPAAGSAAGVLQTGQRVGAALGLAAIGTVFFSALGTPPDFHRAVLHALWTSLAVVGVAFLLTLLDGRALPRGWERARLSPQ